MAVTKSELIELIANKQSQVSVKDIELAVKTLLEEMSQTLSTGTRIEIRGFGSFCLHYRAPRRGRNPKTGAEVELTGKYVPHFKPGKELRDRVNQAMVDEIQQSSEGIPLPAGGGAFKKKSSLRSGSGLDSEPDSESALSESPSLTPST